MTFRAVLFDLDDTLHDKSATLRAVADWQYETEGLIGRAVPRAEWSARFVQLNNERIAKTEVFSRLASEFALPEDLRARMLKEFDANLGGMARPYPGAQELVASCRALGLKVGIVTNGRDAFQRSKIAGLGLVESIDATATSGGLGIKKPDHRIFQYCLAELGVDAKEAAFVGDDFAADMAPAVAMGMQAIWKSVEHSSEVAFCNDDLACINEYLRGVV